MKRLAASLAIITAACTTTPDDVAITRTEPQPDARPNAFAAQPSTTTTSEPVRVRAAAVTPRDEGVIEHVGGLPAVLLAIRWCESRDDYQARNPRSSASGAYQFLDGTWRAYGDSRWPRAYLAPPAAQDAAALRLFRARGTQPWNASRHCWAS